MRPGAGAQRRLAGEGGSLTEAPEGYYTRVVYNPFVDDLDRIWNRAREPGGLPRELDEWCQAGDPA